MLAHAVLAVVRANEQDRHPSSDGLIPLTCKEIQAWSSRSSSNASLTLSTSLAGPSGDAATRPDPRPATTGDKPLKHEDHDLRLEYWAAGPFLKDRGPGPSGRDWRPSGFTYNLSR